MRHLPAPLPAQPSRPDPLRRDHLQHLSRLPYGRTRRWLPLLIKIQFQPLHPPAPQTVKVCVSSVNLLVPPLRVRDSKVTGLRLEDSGAPTARIQASPGQSEARAAAWVCDAKRAITLQGRDNLRQLCRKHGIGIDEHYVWDSMEVRALSRSVGAWRVLHR